MTQSHNGMLFSNKKGKANLFILKYNGNQDELFSLKKKKNIYKMTSSFKYILVCVQKENHGEIDSKTLGSRLQGSFTFLSCVSEMFELLFTTSMSYFCNQEKKDYKNGSSLPHIPSMVQPTVICLSPYHPAETLLAKIANGSCQNRQYIFSSHFNS